MYGLQQLAILLANYHKEKTLSGLVVQPDNPNFIFTLKQFGFTEEGDYWILKNSKVNAAVNMLNAFMRGEPILPMPGGESSDD